MTEFSDDLVKELLSTRRELGRFPFPGGDFDVGVRLLTESEMDECIIRAHGYIRNRCMSNGYEMDEFTKISPETMDIEQQRQILANAIFVADSDPPKKFFKDEVQVRRLDTVIRHELFQGYLDYQDATNTRLSLDKEQVLQLVDALKKEQSAKVLLAQYEPGTLRNLLRSIVAAFPTSTTGSSSTSES